MEAENLMTLNCNHCSETTSKKGNYSANRWQKGGSGDICKYSQISILH